MEHEVAMAFGNADAEFRKLVGSCSEADVEAMRELHDQVVREFERTGFGLNPAEKRARPRYVDAATMILMAVKAAVVAGSIDRGANDPADAAPWDATAAAIRAKELATAAMPMNPPAGDDRRAA